MKKIWIMTAMLEEAQHIINLLKLKKTGEQANLSFWENEKVVLVLAWIGKIQATLATTLLCERYTPTWLINIGISGNLKSKSAKIGDVLIVQKLDQYDMYLPFDGAHLSYAKDPIILPPPWLPEQKRNFSLQFGASCITGDQFVDNEEKMQQLYIATQADIVEMEAFAFASVARTFWKLQQTIIIKAISDWADTQAKSAHMDNLDFAMENSIIILQEVLSILDQD